MNEYDFATTLEYSRGKRQETDLDTIQALIEGCVSVEKTTEQQDRAGVDYIATLRRGASVLIDAKARTPGCARYWTNGPELALELWSVLPENGMTGKVGWTVCEAKNVDYILFTFDPQDSDKAFLYPFQLLRMAFRSHYAGWKELGYQTAVQSSGTWKSQCIFVPESVVWESLRTVMQV